VTSGRVALALPRVVLEEASREATWVCYHGQDFLLLRDQLRSLGVNYLVNSAVRQDTLRLFLLQLLRSEPERRRAERLPLGLRAQCWIGSQLVEAQLLDLSPNACRVVLERKLAPGTLLRIAMPQALAKGTRFEIAGQVGRSLPAQNGQPSWSTAIVFDALPPEDCALIDRMLAGSTLGTPVSRLAAVDAASQPRAARAEDPQRAPTPPSAARAPARIAAAESVAAAPIDSKRAAERREKQRRAYTRKVAVLELAADDSEGLALGRDLSSDGLRLTGCLPLEPGMKVTLALYAGRREEPAVVDAIVLRRESEADFALRFCDPNTRQRKEIGALLAAAPALQSLGSTQPEGAPIAVARLLDAA
jgi:hypothetical protein